MAEIGFNLSVHAVPVVPGRHGQQRHGEHERLARLGDVESRYLPPAPRVQPPGTLCTCGARGCPAGRRR